jgi:hypothetical protein
LEVNFIATMKFSLFKTILSLISRCKCCRLYDCFGRKILIMMFKLKRKRNRKNKSIRESNSILNLCLIFSLSEFKEES